MTVIALALVIGAILGYLLGRYAEANRHKSFNKFGPHFKDLP
jgi:membrane protein DedA with SNARE-associated domain